MMFKKLFSTSAVLAFLVGLQAKAEQFEVLEFAEVPPTGQAPADAKLTAHVYRDSDGYSRHVVMVFLEGDTYSEVTPMDCGRVTQIKKCFSQESPNGKTVEFNQLEDNLYLLLWSGGAFDNGDRIPGSAMFFEAAE